MELSKQPKASSLSQQKMKAFQPIHTLHSTLLILIVGGLTFFFFGSIFTLQATLSTEVVTRYDNLPQCLHSPTCEFELVIEREIFPPVFVYYELRNFYHSHRQFVKSRDNSQLFGAEMTRENVTSTCGEVVDMEDIGRTTSINGSPLSPNTVANPCGLVAKSFFNDTYQLSLNSTLIPVNETDIAWRSDTKFIYNRNEDYLQKQWVDVEDEHFQVWMRTALLPWFRKLWGRVEEVVRPGRYVVKVDNRYNVSHWSGEKHFVLSTANSLGGTTKFLGYILLAGASGCLFILLLILVKSKFRPVLPYEDLDNLHWD